MSTTTIRLPDELKARIAKVAKRDGTTAHKFIIDAITEKAEQAERRAGFDGEAERRYAGIVASGMTIPWSEMRQQLEQQMAGKPARMPTPRKLSK